VLPSVGSGCSSGRHGPRRRTRLLPACRRQPARCPPDGRGSLFKNSRGARILDVMARAGRELAVAHGPQDPAQGLLGDRHAVIFGQDLGQIAQPPPHHTVYGRRRSLFDQRLEDIALVGVQARTGPGGLAVDQPVRSIGVEGHDESRAPFAARPRRSRPPPSADHPRRSSTAPTGGGSAPDHANPWPDRAKPRHRSPIAAAPEQPSHPPQVPNPRNESRPRCRRYPA
jgi:hypothetical protein